MAGLTIESRPLTVAVAATCSGTLLATLGVNANTLRLFTPTRSLNGTVSALYARDTPNIYTNKGKIECFRRIKRPQLCHWLLARKKVRTKSHVLFCPSRVASSSMRKRISCTAYKSHLRQVWIGPEKDFPSWNGGSKRPFSHGWRTNAFMKRHLPRETNDFDDDVFG